jgi:hypothetical protein
MHYRMGHVHVRAALLLSAASAATAVGASYLALQIDEAKLRQFLAVAVNNHCSYSVPARWSTYMHICIYRYTDISVCSIYIIYPYIIHMIICVYYMRSAYHNMPTLGVFCVLLWLDLTCLHNACVPM